MAKTGKLTYQTLAGTTTEVKWFNPSEPVTPPVDFCGTGDPLTIKWSGERHGTTMPSSASIRLVVETLAQRQQLEDIFNGGYVCEVRKGGTLFWSGKVTPTLGRADYRAYPYVMELNANDGIADAKKKRLLAIDYPIPYTVSSQVSVLDMVAKIIEKTFTPNDNYTLFVSMQLYNSVNSTRALENTYLDPLVFMDEDTDSYINISDILESLLGPFGIKLFQWKNNWYLISGDAQWDQGNITLDSYGVASGVVTFNSTSTQKLGIIDMYDCQFQDDYQIGNDTSIEFLAPWLNVKITQEFQTNNNIFPAFANRGGNFYSGHDNTILELDPVPTAERLKHWNKSGLIVTTYPGLDMKNEGSIGIPVTQVDDERPTEQASVSFTIDSSLQFNKFFMSFDTIQSFNDEPVTWGGVGIKRVFYIRYVGRKVSGGSDTWTFWRNNPAQVNDPDAFDGWTTQSRYYKFDHSDQVSVESNMPDISMFQGGTFTFIIKNCYDTNFNETNGYKVFFKNFNFGIVASQFKLVPPQERVKKWYQREWVPILAEGLLSPMPTGVWTAKAAIDRRRQKKADERIGGVRVNRYRVNDINWDDTIYVDINPKGVHSPTYKYRWGLYIPGITNYHEWHLSAAYDLNGDPIDKWQQLWNNASPKDLMTLKSEHIIRDTIEYTTKLSGSWVGSRLTPLQIIHDFEGRYYSMESGTWNDKPGYWGADYIEFKNIHSKPTDPPPGLSYTLTVGTQTDGTTDPPTIDAGFFDEFSVGAITPTNLSGKPIYKLATFASNAIELSVGIPTQVLLPGVTSIKIHFIALGESVTLHAAVDKYQGTLAGIRAYLVSENGNSINIKIEI